MAFLCPSRVGKKTKNKREFLMGRITGSDSIDTVVRVGLEKKKGLDPESRMIILHDFRAFSKGELGVKQGQYVILLYRENDWAYVITVDGKEGFVPYTYCAKILPQSKINYEKKIQEQHGRQTTKHTIFNQVESENMSFDNDSSFGTKDLSEQSTTFPRLVSTSSKSVHPFVQEAIPFRKRFQGEYLVLYNFEAIDENDLGAHAGERVSLLNSEDPFWYWVKNKGGDEGFVPAKYMCNTDRLRRQEAAIAAYQGKLRNKDKLDPSNVTSNTKYWTRPYIHYHISHHKKQDTDWKTIRACTNVQSQAVSCPSISGVTNEITTKLNSAPKYDNFQRHRLHSAEKGSKPEVYEYVCLHDYVAQAQDDLTVTRGDLVYVIKEDQNSED